MEVWLSCSISPGLFTGEYSVRGYLFDNSEFSMFAQVEDLDFEGEPTPENPVEGWIKIVKMDAKDDLLLVNLPRPTLENGQAITVKSNLVKTSQ